MPGNVITLAPMAHSWLLLETLGDDPLVVAQGRALKNLVPLRAFLRRSPFLDVVVNAVAQAVRTGEGASEVLTAQHRVICTEPVKMSDGRVHGVQLWSGPSGIEVPERPLVGALVWDFSTGLATDTRESLICSGIDPDAEPMRPRAFAEAMMTCRDFNASETEALSLTISAEPGQRICTSWDIVDSDGKPINVPFVACANPEVMPDGTTHMISRAMNWRGERLNSAGSPDDLAHRILAGLAAPGVHRALVDINTWTLLKWVDDPCPYYDWPRSIVHPDDQVLVDELTAELAVGPSSRILRLKTYEDTWVHIHVTVNRVQLDERATAGLASLRLPLPAELDELPSAD